MTMFDIQIKKLFKEYSIDNFVPILIHIKGDILFAKHNINGFFFILILYSKAMINQFLCFCFINQSS